MIRRRRNVRPRKATRSPRRDAGDAAPDGTPATGTTSPGSASNSDTRDARIHTYIHTRSPPPPDLTTPAIPIPVPLTPHVVRLVHTVTGVRPSPDEPFNCL
ncbi:unnamed protein product [Danaus chrysippus]|uniref:(African queen) hypothetical protein n=1 Tax=Danaus chrysippus TaxID=151541 RepID=A0A8J2QX26_9NEOP|nr:unnamed protein product [Danaus chrysippus]